MFSNGPLPPPESWEPVETVPDAAVRATFGAPARTYRFDGYTVLVWTVNLLTRMAELPGKCGECSQSHMLEAPADAAS